jgi:hypothetical protein
MRKALRDENVGFVQTLALASDTDAGKMPALRQRAAKMAALRHRLSIRRSALGCKGQTGLSLPSVVPMS